jgi:hypothetical protein
VSITDSEDPNFGISGTFTHADPQLGSEGITPASKAARLDECASLEDLPLSARVIFAANLNVNSFNNQAGITSFRNKIKLGDWVPNTKPVLSEGGLADGSVVDSTFYLEATADATLPHFMGENDVDIKKGQCFTTAINLQGDVKWYRYGGPSAYPVPSKTFEWVYNELPVLSSLGLVDGEPAEPNTCYIIDRDAEEIYIDKIVRLSRGQVIQCRNRVWDYVGFGDTPFMGPNFDCLNFNEIYAVLPSNSEPEGLAPFPNLFIGYYPPPQFQDPYSIRERARFDKLKDKKLYISFQTPEGNSYSGSVTMDNSNSWTGTEVSGNISVETTYTYNIAPVA